MGRFAKDWGVGAAGAVLVIAAVAACDPVDGLNSSNVSVTTDQLATKALKQDHVKVQWLSCSASEDTKDPKVDCVGRTNDQKKITVKGDVTRQSDLKCVQGHLTGAVDGRTVFDVHGLGNC
ncbi:hypothetical protein SAMN05216223_11724 [Actinacidiphila yanglinensis]|uniref:Lipoprotein n=1 Tax=Actinacidiphila yanglinensis TaxID=310779 RepID=A0A1H6DL74_9ACTN|nr:hypothetical protein [Actinacidiphila yanglinensis]SEG86187.1 hypothetical protein SAMN05216223_11724 [Actinacidiphila yanglinensis]